MHGRGEVSAVVRQGQGPAAPARNPAGRACGTGQLSGANVGSYRAGLHQYPRVEQAGRVEDVLDLTEQLDRRRGVHDRQQLAASPAVAVLPGQ